MLVDDKVKVCQRCVMDTTDPTIKFDENGYCNYCNYALETKKKRCLNNEMGEKYLNLLVNKIKEENRKKKYDCLIGLSGGLDSSYLAYIMKKKYNLRMLAIHVDTGWNTKISESNIKKICNKLNIDLVIEKLNEEEFMDLQRAYFLSGVPTQDNPQDHMFQAVLFKYARINKIKYFLSGANFSTESILQKGNSYIAADRVNLLDIHKKYGRIEIKTLPSMSLFDRYIRYRFINKVIMIRPLDCMNYRIKDAIKELEENVEFEYYGGKHHESVFTRFVQEYYLPKRYNFDKKKSHLSSLIISDQITREEAIQKLSEPLYNKEEMEKDIEYIINKMKLTRKEFDDAMNLPLISNHKFKVSRWTKLYKIAVKFRGMLGE